MLDHLEADDDVEGERFQRETGDVRAQEGGAARARSLVGLDAIDADQQRCMPREFRGSVARAAAEIEYLQSLRPFGGECVGRAVSCEVHAEEFAAGVQAFAGEREFAPVVHPRRSRFTSSRGRNGLGRELAREH